MSSASEIIYHTSCRDLQLQHFPARLIKLSIAGWDLFCRLINHCSPLSHVKIQEFKKIKRNLIRNVGIYTCIRMLSFLTVSFIFHNL